jgi:hypothetical protein
MASNLNLAYKLHVTTALKGRRDNSIGIFGYGSEEPRNRCLIPGRIMKISLFHDVQTGSDAHPANPAFCKIDTGGCSPLGEAKWT